MLYANMLLLLKRTANATTNDFNGLGRQVFNMNTSPLDLVMARLMHTWIGGLARIDDHIIVDGPWLPGGLEIEPLLGPWVVGICPDL
jgi:hypothetical protein